MDKERFYLTTVKIITPYDPHGIELEDLARDATSGESICVSQEKVEIRKSDLEENGAGDFFDDPCEDDLGEE